MAVKQKGGGRAIAPPAPPFPRSATDAEHKAVCVMNAVKKLA